MERPRPGGVFSGLAAGLTILLAAGLLAGALKESELYSSSRFLSVILSEDAVELRDLVADRRNAETLLRFVGAVTSAYIDFELIPVGEADAFAAIFRSRPPSVTIDRFEYRGRNLSIYGAATDEGAYDGFVRSLTETESFESVSGSYEKAEGGGITFEIGTVSNG